MAKKGVTAVIATVLLLMMTVAAAGVSYNWINDMQKNIQKSTENKYANDAAKTDAKLFIDSMWKTGSYIEFTLHNTGTYTFSDLTKFSYYVNGIKKTTPASLTGILIAGNITSVITTDPFPTALNTQTTIKLVADTGTSVVYRCEIMTLGQTYC